MKQAVFLDRDGVLNKMVSRNGVPVSPKSFKNFKIIPGTAEALYSLKKLELQNIVVTNQPDISRGLMGIKEMNKMHNYIRQVLPVDDIFVCTHDDKEDCLCRKPNHGMLKMASEKWGVDLEKSFIIGDTWRDMGAGFNAGCKSILIDMHYNKTVHCDFRVIDLSGAVQVIRKFVNINLHGS